MKSLVKLFLVTCIALGFVACSDDNSDPDPGPIRVQGTTVSLLPNSAGLHEETINEIFPDEGLTTMERKIIIKAAATVAQDVEVLLLAAPADFVEDVFPGYEWLAPEFYTIDQNVAVIAAGTDQAEWTIRFKQVPGEMWDEGIPYALPIGIASVSQLSDIDRQNQFYTFFFDYEERDGVVIEPGEDRYELITTNAAQGQSHQFTLNIGTLEPSRRDLDFILEIPNMNDNAVLTDSVNLVLGRDPATSPRTYTMLPSNLYTIGLDGTIAINTTGTEVSVDISHLTPEYISNPNYFVLPVQLVYVSTGGKIMPEAGKDMFYYILDIPKNDQVYLGTSTPASDTEPRTIYIREYTAGTGSITATIPVNVGTLEAANQASTVTVGVVDTPTLPFSYDLLPASYYTLNGSTPTADVNIAAGQTTPSVVNVEVTLPDDFFTSGTNGIYYLPLKVTSDNPSVQVPQGLDTYSVVLFPPAGAARKSLLIQQAAFPIVPLEGVLSTVSATNQMTVEVMFSMSELHASNYILNIPNLNNPYKNPNANFNSAKNAGNAQGGISVVAANSNLNVAILGNAFYTHELAGTGLQPNVWYHLALAVDGLGANGATVYLNGKQIAQTTVTGGTAGSFDDFEFDPTFSMVGGSSFENQPSVDRTFAEFRVWTTRRTEAEIRANMTGIIGDEAGLFYYMPMNDGDTNGDVPTILQNKAIGSSLADGYKWKDGVGANETLRPDHMRAVTGNVAPGAIYNSL